MLVPEATDDTAQSTCHVDLRKKCDDQLLKQRNAMEVLKKLRSVYHRFECFVVTTGEDRGKFNQL